MKKLFISFLQLITARARTYSFSWIAAHIHFLELQLIPLAKWIIQSLASFFFIRSSFGTIHYGGEDIQNIFTLFTRKMLMRILHWCEISIAVTFGFEFNIYVNSIANDGINLDYKWFGRDSFCLRSMSALGDIFGVRLQEDVLPMGFFLGYIIWDS